MNTKNQELFKLLYKLNHKHSLIKNLSNGDIELVVHLSSQVNNIEDRCETLEHKYTSLSKIIVELFKVIKDLTMIIKLLEKNNVKLTKDVELLQSYSIQRSKRN